MKVQTGWFSLATSLSGSHLHAPSPNGSILNDPKDQILHHQPEQDYGEKAGKYVRNQELVFLLEDVPTQPAGTRTDAKDQLGGDQRSPCKRPANLEAREDAGKRTRNQDARDVSNLRKAVILPHHAQRWAHRPKSRVSVQSHGPQHGVDQNKDDASIAQAEPDQRQRQQRDGGQWIKHRR